MSAAAWSDDMFSVSGLEMSEEGYSRPDSIWPTESQSPDDVAPLQEYIAKLRKDVKRVRSALAKRKQELEASNEQVQTEAQSRLLLQRDLEAAQAEVGKLRKSVMGAKETIKMNQIEIQEVETLLESMISRAGLVGPPTSPVRRGRRNRQPMPASIPAEQPAKSERQVSSILAKHASSMALAAGVAERSVGDKTAAMDASSPPYVLRQKEYMSMLPSRSLSYSVGM
eukprot:gb/GFBE01020327.1/.p1 GENE.gb/GFBE01020327.1/~~gb/GFBE01020327.1/.p1  ORF type:complete len:226 (+),score=52.07 gb/GFBE01020327.1/:1-678(+)